MKLIENYKLKILELKLFEKTHAQLFKEYDTMNKELNLLGEELKAEVRKLGDEATDDKLIEAKRIERWTKYYDFKKFLKSATEQEYNELKIADGIETKIFKPVFDELVEKEKISKE